MIWVHRPSLLGLKNFWTGRSVLKTYKDKAYEHLIDVSLDLLRSWQVWNISLVTVNINESYIHGVYNVDELALFTYK